MDTALEVMRIILEYFGWDGNEIEVRFYVLIPSACEQSFKHFKFPLLILMFYVSGVVL